MVKKEVETGKGTYRSASQHHHDDARDETGGDEGLLPHRQRVPVQCCQRLQPVAKEMAFNSLQRDTKRVVTHTKLTCVLQSGPRTID